MFSFFFVIRDAWTIISGGFGGTMKSFVVLIVSGDFGSYMSLLLKLVESLSLKSLKREKFQRKSSTYRGQEEFSITVKGFN